MDYYNAGVDTIALDNQTREYSGDRSFNQNTMAKRFVDQGESRWSMSKAAVIGSPETIGQKLADIIKGAELDGITIIVPDFIDDLQVVGTEVMQVLAANGVHTNAVDFQKAAAA